MTNEELKAKELIDKFRSYVDSEIPGEKNFEFSKRQETIMAKKCAIVVVDEILKNIDATILYNPNSLSIPFNKEYWLGVRAFLSL